MLRDSILQLLQMSASRFDISDIALQKREQGKAPFKSIPEIFKKCSLDRVGSTLKNSASYSSAVNRLCEMFRLSQVFSRLIPFHKRGRVLLLSKL